MSYAHEIYPTCTACRDTAAGHRLWASWPISIWSAIRIRLVWVLRSLLWGGCRSTDDFAVLSDPFGPICRSRRLPLGANGSQAVELYLDWLEVKTVLIGHNHYDHNLDLPYVAPHLHPDAVVLGSDTMMHTFAPSNLPIPLVGLNASLATVDTVGEWWVHPSKRLRVLPILSGHPNNYLFIHLFQDAYTDRQSNPLRQVTIKEKFGFSDHGMYRNCLSGH